MMNQNNQINEYNVEYDEVIDNTDNYSSGKNNKGMDFVFGFGGLIIFDVLYAILSFLFSIIEYSPIPKEFGLIISITLFILYWGLAIGAIILAFKKKRKFIGIGIISFFILKIVLALLLFGACMVLMVGGGAF